MARNMSNVLKLSMVLRKFTSKSDHTVRTIQSLRTSPKFFKGISGDETQSKKSNELPAAIIPKTDSLLMTELNESPTQTRILELTKANGQKMNGHEALVALKALFTLNKMAETQSNSVSTTKEFATLCEILKRNVRQLTNNQAISALKMLIYFRVPTTTVIVQMLLKIICNSVNNLTIEEILFLSFLLPKCYKTPLVEALSVALPIVLRSHIKYQLDIDDVDTVVNVIRFFSRRQYFDHETISSLLNTLNKLDESLIKPDYAKLIMAVIEYADFVETPIEILRKCQKILKTSIHDMDPRHSTKVINITARAHNKGNEVIYDSGLVEACATTIISKDMGLDIAVSTLETLIHLSHAQNSLLDYVIAKCLENKDMGEEIDVKTFEILISGLSSANYKPPLWSMKWGNLLDERLLEIEPRKLLEMGLNLVHLECYWPNLLAKLFTDEGLHQEGEIERRQIAFLYHAVKIYYPRYNGPWPSDEVLKPCAITPVVDQKFPCESALKKALGGSQYFMNAVNSALGHTIDHVAIVGKDGLPIDLADSFKPHPLTIEKLEPPEDGRIILVLYIPKYGCSRNTLCPTGFWACLQRMLESHKNYVIIPIYHDKWSKLSESVKAKHISRRIKLKGC